jgi:hypothetical protein
MRTTLGIFAVLTLAGCINLLGWNKDAAEENATKWASEVGLDASKVVCGASDTDGDGYVSCAFHVGEDVRTFECAGFTFVVPHDGCREPKIKVPRIRSR